MLRERNSENSHSFKTEYYLHSFPGDVLESPETESSTNLYFQEKREGRIPPKTFNNVPPCLQNDTCFKILFQLFCLHIEEMCISLEYFFLQMVASQSFKDFQCDLRSGYIRPWRAENREASPIIRANAIFPHVFTRAPSDTQSSYYQLPEGCEMTNLNHSQAIPDLKWKLDSSFLGLPCLLFFSSQLLFQGKSQ